MDAQVKLDTVALGAVSVRLLMQAESILSQFRQVLQPVKTFLWHIDNTGGWALYSDHSLYHSEPQNEMDRPLHDVFKDRPLPTLVAGAVRLQTLVLHGVHSRVEEGISFRDIIGNLHFPELKMVHLTGIKVAAPDLAGFLVRHKETLIQVKLAPPLEMVMDDSYYDEGPWTQSPRIHAWNLFFTAIAGGLPRLEKMYVSGDCMPSQVHFIFGSQSGEQELHVPEQVLEYFKTSIPRPRRRRLRDGTTRARELGLEELLRWIRSLIGSDVQIIQHPIRTEL